mmetsp:Transcript_8249/g.15021  ORF Transcript_8249/g.15021 Transcript_8249/m.15021 type:complete len:201 (-) Transcript_8249:65-667(-)
MLKFPCASGTCRWWQRRWRWRHRGRLLSRPSCRSVCTSRRSSPQLWRRRRRRCRSRARSNRSIRSSPRWHRASRTPPSARGCRTYPLARRIGNSGRTSPPRWRRNRGTPPPWLWRRRGSRGRLRRSRKRRRCPSGRVRPFSGPQRRDIRGSCPTCLHWERAPRRQICGTSRESSGVPQGAARALYSISGQNESQPGGHET